MNTNTDSREDTCIDKNFEVNLCLPVLIIELVAKSAEQARRLVREMPEGKAFFELFSYQPIATIVTELDEDEDVDCQ